jgi:hypothetical protein
LIELLKEVLKLVRKEFLPAIIFGFIGLNIIWIGLTLTKNAQIGIVKTTIEMELQKADIQPDLKRIKLMLSKDSNNINLLTQKDKLEGRLAVYTEGIRRLGLTFSTDYKLGTYIIVFGILVWVVLSSKIMSWFLVTNILIPCFQKKSIS